MESPKQRWLTTPILMVLFFATLSSCQIKKNKVDYFKYLTSFKLCNDSESETIVLDPYASIESIRITSERSFFGDTLLIRMITDVLNYPSVHQNLKNENGQLNITRRKLAANECMTFYLELTEIEKSRIALIEKLVIKIQVYDESQCFVRHSISANLQTEDQPIKDKLTLCR